MRYVVFNLNYLISHYFPFKPEAEVQQPNQLHCTFVSSWWLTNFIIYGLKWYMAALNWRIIKYFLFVKYFWSNKAIIHYGTTGKMASFICRHKRSVYGVVFLRSVRLLRRNVLVRTHINQPLSSSWLEN